MVVKHVVTEQMPCACVAHMLHQIVRKMCERSVSSTVRAHSQEIIGHRDCFTAAVKHLSCALALILFACMAQWLFSTK
jgi:hypothetical protein